MLGNFIFCFYLKAFSWASKIVQSEILILFHTKHFAVFESFWKLSSRSGKSSMLNFLSRNISHSTVHKISAANMHHHAPLFASVIIFSENDFYGNSTEWSHSHQELHHLKHVMKRAPCEFSVRWEKCLLLFLSHNISVTSRALLVRQASVHVLQTLTITSRRSIFYIFKLHSSFRRGKNWNKKMSLFKKIAFSLCV